MKKEKQELFDYDKLFKNYLFEAGAKIDFWFGLLATEQITNEECRAYIKRLDEEVQNEYGYDNFQDLIRFVDNDLFEQYFLLKDMGFNKSMVLDCHFLYDYNSAILRHVNWIDSKITE